MKLRLPWYKPQAKENPVNKVILSNLPKTEIWTPTNYENLSKAGYKNCMTAYSCVNKIAKNAAGIAWQVENLKGDEQENHPCLLLLKRPNPQQGQRVFIEQVLSHLLLTGNTYIFVATGGGRPQFLYSLRPDRMKVMPGTGYDLIGGYRYTVSGQQYDFKPTDILHIKFFNPLDDFYGMGPVEAAARGVDISNYADTWNAAIIKNDMKPAGAFTTPGVLTQPQFDRIKNQIQEEYMGYDNAGRPLILEGDLKFQPFSMSPKDLDWLNSDKANMRKICTVFGVPSQLFGDTEASTYSNYQEARKALYTETVLPMMQSLTDDLNNWLLPLYGQGLELKIDTEQIEVLQENRAEKFGYLQACDWLTVNEKRTATGYDEVGPEGDEILVPVGKIPLEQQVEEPEPVPAALAPATLPEEEPIDSTATEEEMMDDEGKAHKFKKSHWSKPERKEKLWRSFELRIKAREKSFESIAKEYLRRQAESITAKVESIGLLDSVSAEKILDIRRETKRYIEVFTPWYTDHFLRAMSAGVAASKGDIFDDASFKAKPTSWVAEMTDEQRQALKKMIFNSGTKVNETALGKIESYIVQANENNWTVNEFAQKLSENVFDLVNWRAQLWARTESVKVDSFGQVEGFKDIEFVNKKGWMCSQVPDSRDAHLDADGQEVLLDDDFIVGGEPMGYPGDPKGSAGNVCNCLCSVYPIVGEI